MDAHVVVAHVMNQRMGMGVTSMITQDYQVLTPAYGRDYKNKQSCVQDFLDGQDFVLNSPMGVTYCSIRDFAPNTLVNLRYKRLTLVTNVRVP